MKIIEPKFFTVEDLQYLSKWADKVYNKENKKHIEAKDNIMNTLWEKTAYWANELVKKLPQFEASTPFYWMDRGWDDSIKEKKQVVRFKTYTWSKIFKKGDKDKDIFFTFGVSSKKEALLYKLDYFSNNGSKLTSDQKDLCKQLIPEELNFILIPFDKIHQYNWSKLLYETKAFIRDNQKVYEGIIDSVWKGKIKVPKLKNRLIKRGKNYEGLTEVPQRKFLFKGVEVNWDENHKKNSLIGKLGEELVIEYEKNNLKNKKLHKFVKKVKDGKGYDIISRFENGKEKYIEVKTTTSSEKTPFPISINEILYSELNPKSYYLYRVFNLNKKDKVAEFFEYEGNLKKLFLFEGVQFVGHLKKMGS